MANKNNDIIVLGAGVGGLAVAIRLALKNYKVTILEKNSSPGGKLSQITKKGFRFDLGPSLFTLPEKVQELFQLAGKDFRNYFELKKLENTCKYFYGDGTIINAWSDSAKFAKELKIAGEDPENLHRYLARYKKLYEVSAPVFLENDFHDFNNFTKPEFSRTLRYLPLLDPMATMHKRNRQNFSTEYAVKIFDRYATYNGSSPYKAPATLNMISHLENNLCAFFPIDGMFAIAKSLEKLATESGVEIKYNCEVTDIIAENKNVTSLKTIDNQEYKADYYISNMDVSTFYRNFFSEFSLPASVKGDKLSSSAIIFYWGIEGEFPEMELHNILFADDYEAEFNAVFEKNVVYSDPTVYIFISSKEVKSDAPSGCENWYVMVNTPFNSGQDWEEEALKVKGIAIEKIKKITGIDLDGKIKCEVIGNPVTIETFTGSYKGSLYGNNSNNMFSAFLRHPNKTKRFGNLFFTGGSVHPGGGVPLCLSSAKIVAEKFQPL